MTCLSLRMGTAQPFAHQSIIFETSYGPVGKSLEQQSLKIGAPTIQERTPQKENSEMGNFDVTKIPGNWITWTKLSLSIINTQV